LISIYLYLYIHKQIISMKQNDNTKLTTVKLLKDVYSSFKKVSFDSDVTLQKLVNRTVERYVTDEEFRQEMNEYLKLQISGSQF
jgi:hypothetical protein